MKLKTKNISGSNQEHALLSPSAAKKWLGCPAALACEFGIPNESGQAAVLGTAMHTISEIHLNRYIDGTARALEADEGCYVMDNGKGGIVAKAKAPKGGVLITKDMIDQCRKYTDYCKPIIDAADYVKLEMRAELTQVLHPGYQTPEGEPLSTFGTADLVAVMPRADVGHMLIIGDLKTGRHRVEAKENKQLMLYALGVMRRLRRKYDITLVRLVIFQPYAGGESEWDITPEALAQFGKFAAARAVMALDVFYKGRKLVKISDFKPSADACQWCRFAEKCTARAKSAVQIGSGQSASDSDLSDTGPAEMTPEQLKAAYDKLPELRQHIATIEKAVYSALHKGVKVPGLKLVEGRPGNRTWTDADAIEVSHGDVLKKEVLMSPTEAAKVLSAAEMAELEPFITRKPGQPSVAPEDDKREEWKAASDEDLT